MSEITKICPDCRVAVKGSPHYCYPPYRSDQSKPRTLFISGIDFDTWQLQPTQAASAMITLLDQGRTESRQFIEATPKTLAAEEMANTQDQILAVLDSPITEVSWPNKVSLIREFIHDSKKARGE